MTKRKSILAPLLSLGIMLCGFWSGDAIAGFDLPHLVKCFVFAAAGTGTLCPVGGVQSLQDEASCTVFSSVDLPSEKRPQFEALGFTVIHHSDDFFVADLPEGWTQEHVVATDSLDDMHYYLCDDVGYPVVLITGRSSSWTRHISARFLLDKEKADMLEEFQQLRKTRELFEADPLFEEKRRAYIEYKAIASGALGIRYFGSKEVLIRNFVFAYNRLAKLYRQYRIDSIEELLTLDLSWIRNLDRYFH
jgi:hypothetical protein